MMIDDDDMTKKVMWLCLRSVMTVVLVTNQLEDDPK